MRTALLKHPVGDATHKRTPACSAEVFVVEDEDPRELSGPSDPALAIRVHLYSILLSSKQGLLAERVQQAARILNTVRGEKGGGGALMIMHAINLDHCPRMLTMPGRGDMTGVR